jgi:hypothetical protein
MTRTARWASRAASGGRRDSSWVQLDARMLQLDIMLTSLDVRMWHTSRGLDELTIGQQVALLSLFYRRQADAVSWEGQARRPLHDSASAQVRRQGTLTEAQRTRPARLLYRLRASQQQLLDELLIAWGRSGPATSPERLPTDRLKNCLRRAGQEASRLTEHALESIANQALDIQDWSGGGGSL